MRCFRQGPPFTRSFFIRAGSSVGHVVDPSLQIFFYFYFYFWHRQRQQADLAAVEGARRRGRPGGGDGIAGDSESKEKAGRRRRPSVVHSSFCVWGSH